MNGMGKRIRNARSVKAKRGQVPSDGKFQSWTAKRVLQVIRARRRSGECLAPGHIATHDRPLYNACIAYWGSYKNAVENAGLQYANLRKGPHKWKAETILAELRRRFRKGEDLSHNVFQRTNRSLMSGARRQFGSYRNAVEAAGISYAKVAKELQRSWDRQTVINTIRRKYRRGQQLSYNYMKKNDSILFSAIHRYFKTFRAAIKAAGLAYEQVAEVPQESWDKERVIRKLRAMVRSKKRITQRSMGTKLFGAVTRYFGTISKAVKAAGLPVAKWVNVPPEPWTKTRTFDELKTLTASGQRVITANMSYGLHRHLLQYFGSVAKAARAAGLDYPAIATKHPMGTLEQGTRAQRNSGH